MFVPSATSVLYIAPPLIHAEFICCAARLQRDSSWKYAAFQDSDVKNLDHYVYPRGQMNAGAAQRMLLPLSLATTPLSLSASTSESTSSHCTMATADLPFDILSIILTAVVFDEAAADVLRRRHRSNGPLRLPAQRMLNRRASLSRVNRCWHAAIASTPALWTILYISPKTTANEVRTHIDRAANGLHVTVDLYPDLPASTRDLIFPMDGRAVDVLMAHSHRMLSLDILVVVDHFMPVVQHRIFRHGTVFSRLERLCVVNTRPTGTLVIDYTAPELRELYLVSCTASDDHASCGSKLTSLSLSDNISMHWSALLHLVRTQRKLRSLVLDSIALLPPDAAQYSVGDFESLQALETVEVHGNAAVLLNKLPVSAVDVVITSLRPFCLYGRPDVPLLLEGTDWTQLTAFYGSRVVLSVPETHRARQRHFIGSSDFRQLFSRSPYAFRMLQRISVDMLAFLEVSSTIAASVVNASLIDVTHLTLVHLETSDHPATVAGVLQWAITTIRDDITRRMYLPSLQELTLKHVGGGVEQYVSLKDVSDFLTVIVPGGERPSVELEGIILGNTVTASAERRPGPKKFSILSLVAKATKGAGARKL